MKKIIAIVVCIIFVLGVSSFAFAAEEKAIAKCEKCHKGDKALDKIAAAKKFATADDLIKDLRGSAKAKMHEKFKDEDLKAVAKELKLK